MIGIHVLSTVGRLVAKKIGGEFFGIRRMTNRHLPAEVARIDVTVDVSQATHLLFVVLIPQSNDTVSFGIWSKDSLDGNPLVAVQEEWGTDWDSVLKLCKSIQNNLKDLSSSTLESTMDESWFFWTRKSFSGIQMASMWRAVPSDKKELFNSRQHFEQCVNSIVGTVAFLELSSEFLNAIEGTHYSVATMMTSEERDELWYSLGVTNLFYGRRHFNAALGAIGYVLAELRMQSVLRRILRNLARKTLREKPSA